MCDNLILVDIISSVNVEESGGIVRAHSEWDHRCRIHGPIYGLQHYLVEPMSLYWNVRPLKVGKL